MWNYIKDGETLGPVSPEQLIALLQSGGISRDTLIWTKGQADWVPASHTRFGDHFPPPLPAVSPSAQDGDDVPSPIPRNASTGGIRNLVGTAIALATIFSVRACLRSGHSTSAIASEALPAIQHDSQNTRGSSQPEMVTDDELTYEEKQEMMMMRLGGVKEGVEFANKYGRFPTDAEFGSQLEALSNITPFINKDGTERQNRLFRRMLNELKQGFDQGCGEVLHRGQ